MTAMHVCRKDITDDVSASKFLELRLYASNQAGSVSILTIQNHPVMQGDRFALAIGLNVVR